MAALDDSRMLRLYTRRLMQRVSDPAVSEAAATGQRVVLNGDDPALNGQKATVIGYFEYADRLVLRLDCGSLSLAAPSDLNA